MKVLYLDLYFKLPDDFKGDINNALRELIKYRESKGLSGAFITSDDADPPKEEKIREVHTDILWEKFLEKTKDDNINIVGYGSCNHWGGKKWINLDDEGEE